MSLEIMNFQIAEYCIVNYHQNLDEISPKYHWSFMKFQSNIRIITDILLYMHHVEIWVKFQHHFHLRLWKS